MCIPLFPENVSIWKALLIDGRYFQLKQNCSKTYILVKFLLVCWISHWSTMMDEDKNGSII